MIAAMRMQGGKGDSWMVMPDLGKQQVVRRATLLGNRPGISVPPRRKGFFSTKRVRMHELKYADFQDYYELVALARQGQVERSYLLDRQTIHETRFNCHSASFRLIDECCLPAKFEDTLTYRKVKD